MMDLVRRLREQRGWSQEQLAKVAEISKRTIQRIESGEVEPSPETAKDLARALDRSAGDFIRHSGLRARLREIVAKGPHHQLSAEELRGLPADMRSLFVAYQKEVAGIDADRRALMQIRVESEMLHDEAMATLDANAKAWSVIWADDTDAGLRSCEEIRVRLESLKRNAVRRDEVVKRLNVTTQSLLAKTMRGLKVAAKLDRALDAYDAYA